MGFRYRRAISVARGVRLNVTERGVTSVSVGRPGATLNFSKRGFRPTVGLPGTGLSYTGRSSGPLIMVVGLIVAGVVALFVQAARGSRPAQVAVVLLSLAVIAIGIMSQADRWSVSATAPTLHVARATSPGSGTFVTRPIALPVLMPMVAPIASATEQADAPAGLPLSGPLVKIAIVLAYANVRAAPAGCRHRAVIGWRAAKGDRDGSRVVQGREERD